MTTKKQKSDELRKVVLESGIEVNPVYGPDDIKNLDFDEEIGRPGKYPFTRGIHPFMYRKRPWTMRQYSGFGTAKETNKRFKWLLEQGQTALNVAFDLPTQLGLDSDDPFAEEEVGRVGMAIDTLEDLEDAFDGIPIEKISTSLTINPVASVMLAMRVPMMRLTMKMVTVSVVMWTTAPPSTILTKRTITMMDTGMLALIQASI